MPLSFDSIHEAATKLLGIFDIEFTKQDEYHVADVTLKVLDGFQATGKSRLKYRALGFALRDISNSLISSGQ